MSDANPLIRQTPAHTAVTIRAGRAQLRDQLREVWSYRELLYFLVWRDVKVRYKQTAFGVAWAVLHPLIATVIFALFFGRLANMPSDGIPYPLFAFVGVLQWTFFATSVMAAAGSLLTNTELVTKVFFPRLLIPTGAVAAALIDAAIGLILFLAISAWYGYPISWSILLIPFFLLMNMVLALGVGGWLAAVVVRYRDVRHVLTFVIQIWMFASPVVYPASLVPERWRWVLALNPMTGIIEGTRSVAFGLPLDGATVAISAATSCLMLWVALRYFAAVEDGFADVI